MNPSSDALTRRRFTTLALAAPLAAPFAANAQAFPAKPIKIYVPYAPGGGADGNARLLAQHMAAHLGQPVVIENKTGASGVVAANATVQAPADGYTVLYETFPYAVNAVLRKLPFNPTKDLAPVSQAVNMPNILVVQASAPYKTLKELVDYARANPGKLSYASYGAGGAAHLAAEMLRAEARIDWVHVPYRGGAPAIADLVAGQVQAYFANPVSGLSFIQSGRLRALAVTSAQRLQVLPDVPTFKESGYPDFELVEWNGLLVPAATPADAVNRLAGAVRYAVQQPEVRQRMLASGIEPVGNTPQEFGRFLQGQIAQWGALAKANHITLD